MKESHLKSLERRHEVLESRILAESRHAAHDPALIKRLKSQKLRLKEEIAQLHSVH
jgi:hypothetical protein